MTRTLTRGLIAGAAGTTVLDAIGYLDKNFCHVRRTDAIVAELDSSAARSSELLTA